MLGPSGCGKTTLLRMIAGFIQPDHGKIILDDKEITQHPAEKRPLNMVFQNYALFPHMNVFDNVAFGLRCAKMEKQLIQQKVMTALKRTHIESLQDRKPDQLSGGQQQRVALARAIVNEPRVLLLDEPLSALDYRLRQQLQRELKKLQRELNITFIFVTHDQEEALSMSDRIAIMNQGEIIQLGTPRDIYEEPANLFAAQFIGEANVFNCIVEQVTQTHLSTTIANQTFCFKNKHPLTQGQAIHIIVRPEDIRAWHRDEIKDHNNALAGKIKEVIYKGSTVDLWIELSNGKMIQAHEFFDEDDAELCYDINETVFINWLPDWEVILKDESTHD